MKLSAVSDGLGHRQFEEVAKVSAELGLSGLEICMATGRGLRMQIYNHGCGEHGEAARLLVRVGAKWVIVGGAQLAAVISFTRLTENGKTRLLMTRCEFGRAARGKRFVPMSGLPAGGPNDVRPNWITTAWPFEYAEIL